jgi:uncharacterized protein YndB with AHSA1/START domain
MELDDTDVASRSLRVTRSLDAPINLVWRVWTSPEHIAQWWGPSGFTNTIHTMDLVAGGEWRLTMKAPDGKTYPNKSIFKEVAELSKIVFQHFNPNYLATVRFQSVGGTTVLEWMMEFETVDLFETVVKVFKADEGLNQNVDKLEEYLKTTLKKELERNNN